MWFEYMCAAAAAKVSIYAYNVFIIQASNVMSHCSINSRRPRALRLVLTHRRPAFFFLVFRMIQNRRLTIFETTFVC